jgi:hypothetical protein
MKLNENQLNVITNDGTYECLLTKQRFAVSLFQEPSATGNVICFEAPVKIGQLAFKDAYVVCGELPNTNIFGGVCFHRLYSAQLGSILFNITQLECYVEENSIFINGNQASLSIVNTIKDSSMLHIIFPKTVDVKDFHALELNPEQAEAFQQHSIACFEKLTRSIFLETRRDNI